MTSGIAALGLLAVASLVAVRLIRPRLAPWVPDIFVYLALGLAFGTSGLGAYLGVIAPQGQASDIARAVQLAALYLLVFPSCAGLKTSGLQRHFTVIGTLLGASVAALVIALLTVDQITSLAPDETILAAGEGSRQAYFLTLSLGVMVCSVPFLTKIFVNVGLQQSPFAHGLLLAACFIDVLVWALFALAVSLRDGSGLALDTMLLQMLWGIGITLTAGLTSALAFYCLAHAFRRKHREAPWALLLISSILLVLLMHMAGLAPVIAMVMCGLGVAPHRDVFGAAIARFERLSVTLGAPVYFTCVGYSIPPTSVVSVEAVLVFILWSSAIKIACVSLAAGFIKRPGESRLDYGIAMNTRGGPGLVLAASAYAVNLIPITSFVALTSASVLTALFTELYLKAAAARIQSSQNADGGARYESKNP